MPGNKLRKLGILGYMKRIERDRASFNIEETTPSRLAQSHRHLKITSHGLGNYCQLGKRTSRDRDKL